MEMGEHEYEKGRANVAQGHEGRKKIVSFFCLMLEMSALNLCQKKGELKSLFVVEYL
jgi:hypothetical protein